MIGFDWEKALGRFSRGLARPGGCCCLPQGRGSWPPRVSLVAVQQRHRPLRSSAPRRQGAPPPFRELRTNHHSLRRNLWRKFPPRPAAAWQGMGGSARPRRLQVVRVAPVSACAARSTARGARGRPAAGAAEAGRFPRRQRQNLKLQFFWVQNSDALTSHSAVWEVVVVCARQRRDGFREQGVGCLRQKGLPPAHHPVWDISTRCALLVFGCPVAAWRISPGLSRHQLGARGFDLDVWQAGRPNPKTLTGSLPGRGVRLFLELNSECLTQ